MTTPTPDERLGAGEPGKPSGILVRFAGTDNPRHLRVIRALLRAPVARIELDRVAGCTNGPDLIGQLRGLGLSLPCERVTVKDRDGRTSRPGRYSLTGDDCKRVHRWLRVRAKGRRA